MQLTNVGSTPWNPAATLCLQNISALDFNDFEGRRTAITVDGDFLSVNTAARGRSRSDSLGLHHAHLLRPEDLDWVHVDALKYFEGTEIASSSLVVRSAKDGRRHVALAWEDARHVSYNLNQQFNCIHSEPRFGALSPGETRTVSGKIYFVDGSLDDLKQRFVSDFSTLGFGRSHK